MAGSAQLLNEPSTVVSDSAAAQDLWIFRDGKSTVSGKKLLDKFQGRLQGPLDGSDLIDALIEAGELEAALADAGQPHHQAASITDALAAMLCGGSPESATWLVDATAHLPVPSELRVSPPEGFTYYALHPGDFAGITSQIPAEPGPCAVVGIRSIGTTLSAVALAALSRQGRQAVRTTVRPEGHPYARKTEFSASQRAWIDGHSGWQFVVADEGPGRSGSTFLSVAEALVQAGIPRERITLIGSRQPDASSLCANDAANRWHQFRFLSTVPSVNTRFEGCTYIGGGEWRKFLLPAKQPWPESWTQMERLKFISPDWKFLYKFEGMGAIGAEARARACQLAAAGFGPEVCDAQNGFLSYSLVEGDQLQAKDADGRVLEHIAQYCAFRDSEVLAPFSEQHQLREMLQFNLAQEFGVALSLGKEDFYSERIAITDGRMQPYEWIAARSGRIIKIDGVDHGDNHFFPGPCDIAWDLAGTSVEWHLDDAARDYLLSCFQRQSGRDISARFQLYQLAYLVFRAGFCKMAISTVKGTPEESRLEKAYLGYRARACTAIEEFGRQPL